MNAERRKLLTWSAAGASMLGLAGQAAAETAAADAAQGGGVSPLTDVGSGRHTGQPRASMKHAVAETVIMLAELNVKPGKLAEFLEYTTANLKLSRSYPGNLGFDILLNDLRPDTVIFYEVWNSADAQRRYMAWRVQAGDLTKLLSYLTGEPKFTRLRRISA